MMNRAILCIFGDVFERMTERKGSRGLQIPCNEDYKSSATQQFSFETIKPSPRFIF